MSSFVRHLNLIKIKRTLTWLTPSQQVAFTQVEKELRASSTVNLFGGVGVGKTFLTWMLADQLNYGYISHPEELGQVSRSELKGVVVDNCRPNRLAHRDLLKELRFHGVPHAVLVTRQMIYDYTHYVELQLTKEDETQVQENLISVGIVLIRTNQPNLWHLVNPYL
jgi:hypothetical protein